MMKDEFFKRCTFQNNNELHRFELKCNESIAYVNYIVDGNKMILVTSHIPRQFHVKKGFGEELLKRIKIDLKSNGAILDSICPYFNALMRKG